MTEINWVFGYGSLIWDPGFAVAESVRARLDGYARSFCLRSVEYRGTYDRPGLVLGLDPDPAGHCTGLAMRFEETLRAEVLAYLRARELTTDAYVETVVPLRLEDGREVQALTYVMRRDHWQYAGGLCLTEQAAIIAAAHGGRGPNCDYLFNTAHHLAQLGLPDEEMDQLTKDVRHLIEGRP